MANQRLVASAALALALAPLSAWGTAQDAGTTTPASLPVLHTLDLGGEMAWYYQSDVGLLLVFAEGRLHRVDLLSAGAPRLDPIPFPSLEDRGAVVPLARTGILLLPSAPSGLIPRTDDTNPERENSSYAIDTVAGTYLWEAAPLPAVNIAFSFPDMGLAVIRSMADAGSVLAVDVLTGQRRWTHDLRATMIWIDRPWVRLITGSDLLTIDIATGEIVRRDEVAFEDRGYALWQDGVFLDWKNRNVKALTLPPPPPAEAAPAKPLWEFKAGGYMIDACIKQGHCSIDRVADNRLLVRSATHYELVDVRTGKVVLDARRGGFAAEPSLSPGGAYVAVAGGDELRVLDGTSGEMLHEIPYPKGGEGLKLSRFLRWLADDVAVVVFPDKDGDPRRMSAFSCSQGKLLWTLALPDGADYFLTSQQRASLIGRIALSLVATAASVSSPMSIGGTSYAVILVPSLDLSPALGPGLAGGADASSGTAAPLLVGAQKRFEACRKRSADEGLGRTHYVIGPKGKYDVLEIDRTTGATRVIGRHEATKVHGIALFPAFDVGLSLEDERRVVRILDLRGK